MFTCQMDVKLFNEEGVCQELIDNKYLYNKTLAQVEAKSSDSLIGKALLELKMSSELAKENCEVYGRTLG